jgi:DNA-binding HxlR family transcriptional regulator
LIQGVSDKVLIQQLKDLEAERIRLSGRGQRAKRAGPKVCL